MSFLTQQMSTLGSVEQADGEHSQPISTPFAAPVAATPFCSPTGHGIFGGNSVSIYVTYNKVSGMTWHSRERRTHARTTVRKCLHRILILA